MRYPNGKPYTPASTTETAGNKSPEYARRGMTLEEDLNQSNKYYLNHGVAVIHKKPTPIQIVDVHYPKRSAAKITEAYFKQPSTTDYNGVYRGHYIDFEAKETRNAASFPMKNLHAHQLLHMEEIQRHGGLAFVLIRFTASQQTFLLDATHVLHFQANLDTYKRKSMPLPYIEEHGQIIAMGFAPRIDYLKAVDHYYFSHL
ncbi:recombination protein U [Aureibacillus halotolerans]|uniref:Holliday junction resolvase RecU n=1 Tax=Aureibacillus halotolerans TaxID=1508390 RepID=A0A4R6U742_9BACI|nr:recombination protein U [Aureibacillus halotolerans]